MFNFVVCKAQNINLRINAIGFKAQHCLTHLVPLVPIITRKWSPRLQNAHFGVRTHGPHAQSQILQSLHHISHLLNRLQLFLVKARKFSDTFNTTVHKKISDRLKYMTSLTPWTPKYPTRNHEINTNTNI